MAFKYNDREFYHGNQRLTIADLKDNNKASNPVFATGLVSVSAMEDKAEITNFPADDIPDHATIAGTPLLNGTIVMAQLDGDVRTDFMGQDTTTSGKGYGSTSNYPQKCVQFVSLGTNRDGQPLMLVTVYPNMSVTSKPTKETSTDSSDKPTQIKWTAKVQATGSPYYTTKSGAKAAEFEYRFEGAEVQAVESFIDGGGIVTPDYTVNAAGDNSNNNTK